MNSRADELGLCFTRFINPHGLQNSLNVSTAKDIPDLSMHAAKNNLFRRIMNTECYRCYYYQTELRIDWGYLVWHNTNALLRKGWQGVKKGKTLSAGSCLASLKDGIYIVVLNCTNNQRRFTETEQLYKWYVKTFRMDNESVLDDC